MARKTNTKYLNYASAKKKIKNGEIAPIYLFFGEEKYLLDDLIDTLIEKYINPNSKDLDVIKFYLDNKPSKLDFNRVVQELKTPSFLSEKKIILIKDSSIFSPKGKSYHDKMQMIFDNLNHESIVIFYEDKARRYKKLFDQILALGDIVKIDALSTNELRTWVASFFKLFDIKIYNNAAESLVERCSRDMYTIRYELDKLKLIAEAKDIKVIDLDMINKFSIPDIQGNIFNLTDAISAKRIDQALKIYENITAQGMSPVYIIYMIARQFKQLYVAKHVKSKSELRSRLNCANFVANKLMQQRNYFTSDELYKIYQAIAAMDYKSKTGRVEQEESVELLILEIANI